MNNRDNKNNRRMATIEEASIVGRNTSTGNSLVEVVERIIDKGIVIDAWVSVSLVGIEILTVQARVIISSLETYVKHAEALYIIGPVAGGHRGEKAAKSLKEGIQEIKEGSGFLPKITEMFAGDESDKAEEKDKRIRKSLKKSK